MDVNDLFGQGILLPELKATAKTELLEELVGKLAEAEKLAAADIPKVIKALLKREQLGSTGIGQGVAVPHAKTEAVSQTICAFGRSQAGIPYESLDGAPVHLAFLVLSPLESAGEQMTALAAVSRWVRNETFVRFLRTARDERGLRETLQEAR